MKRDLFWALIGASVVVAIVASGANWLQAAPAQKRAIGPSGGSVPILNFAIVGDSRPANQDDTAGYPTSIITTIFDDIEALSPQPDFVVATGDYMYAKPGNGQSAPQAALYMQAAKHFSGQVFPAIGNHECTGYTNSDCGIGNSDGITENYTTFLTDILGGFGLPDQLPYYSVNIDSGDVPNPWTAKFVFVAPNAWTTAQATWLQTTLSAQTTYTFIIKHEPYYDATECPGCGASDDIIKQYPATLLVFGHTHTYQYVSPNELVVGNGGAPLDASSDQYGYVQCLQQADESIECTEHDYNASTSSYQNATIRVTPAGAVAQ